MRALPPVFLRPPPFLNFSTVQSLSSLFQLLTKTMPPRVLLLAGFIPLLGVLEPLWPSQSEGDMERRSRSSVFQQSAVSDSKRLLIPIERDQMESDVIFSWAEIYRLSSFTTAANI